jgi:hypothetical protein
MKVGDMVRSIPDGVNTNSRRVGIVVDIIQKKVWRAGCMGKKVDWSIVDPEPHAVVLFSHNDGTLNIPVVELQVVE